MLNKKLTLPIKNNYYLYLRFNCIGFTGNYFLLAGFSTFYRRHPILPAIIYQILLCPLAGSVIPTEEPQYIMEDELSPPKSNHK